MPPASGPYGGGTISGKKTAVVVIVVVIVVVLLLVVAAFLGSQDDGPDVPPRSETIPSNAVKMTPATDQFPPILHSDEWATPVPMPGPVNTAGAEDSPFISPDGNRFFFFFTPDVTVPANEQLLDRVTGIWWCRLVNGSWTEPERIVLSDDVALDGAEFVTGDTMWFASVRVGNYGEIDVYTAELEDGEWDDVKNAGIELNQEYDIGEFHIAPDGATMYFHTGNVGFGESMDLWTTTKTSSGWSEPVEVPGVNTAATEGYPFITADGNELWYTGTSKLGYPGPALFRCTRSGDSWSAATEVVSQFAGECTMDSEKNMYFVHHYFTQDPVTHNMTMIEADIYVAYHVDGTRSCATTLEMLDGAPGVEVVAAVCRDTLLPASTLSTLAV